MKKGSLREELQNYIEEELWITNDSLPYHTDQILKLFEKRIESLKGQLDNKDDTMMISTLNWVKELLK